MKVLQIITKGEAGGAQSHLLELCRGLHPRVELSVVIGGAESHDALGSGLAELGILHQRLPAMANSLSPWRVLLATRSLVRMSRRLRPDLMHAHSAMAGVAARLAGLVTGIPVVYTVHGFGFKPQVPRLQRLIALLVEWLLAPCTARMICVSEHERELTQRLPLSAQRICVIHNGIQDCALRADPATAPMRVIMVARCAPPKRQDILLQALAHAANLLGREIPATLVGGGPRLAALKTQAHSLGLQDVEFSGDVGNVPERLASHNLFVLISDHEGLPISVIEAMRAGLPVLGSDLPGMRELIAQGQQGCLLDNQVAALGKALADLDGQAQTRARWGLAARHRYEQEFDGQAMSQAVLSCYVQILSHESRVHH